MELDLNLLLTEMVKQNYDCTVLRGHQKMRLYCGQTTDFL